jgi:hypothetical protein
MLLISAELSIFTLAKKSFTFVYRGFPGLLEHSIEVFDLNNLELNGTIDVIPQL